MRLNFRLLQSCLNLKVIKVFAVCEIILIPVKENFKLSIFEKNLWGTTPHFNIGLEVYFIINKNESDNYIMYQK